MITKLLLIIFVSSVECAKILGIFMSASYSHHTMFQPIWKELSLQGHEVLVATPNPINDPKLVNLTEIDLSEDSYKNFEYFKQAITTSKNRNSITDFMLMYKSYINLTEVQLRHPVLQDLIHNKSKYHFDLLLVEYLFPAMYPFKEIFNCPMIGLLSFPMPSTLYSYLGIPYHPVLSPEVNQPYSIDLSFKERVHSVLYKHISRIALKIVSTFVLQGLLEQHYGNIKNIDEIAEDVSLVLVNENTVLHHVKLVVPAYVPISGIHIKPIKPLPKGLKSFLDKSKQGVIYVSFGSYLNVEQCDKNIVQKLKNVFKQLPFNILWKYDATNKNNIPNNVKTGVWFPQQDVLAHPNLKLFITQGGLQSLDESVSRQVPVIIMPFFDDQKHNADRFSKLGVGLHVNLFEFTEKELISKINAVIMNPKYKKNIVELSAIAFDQPIKPLDKAIWHINYVLRHRGARHLRYGALDLPWYYYEMLDVYAFLLISTTITLYLTRKCFKILLHYLKEKFKKKTKVQ